MATPTHLSRYQIENAIGHGMMGAVYKATDPALGRSVALKVVSPALPIPEPERLLLEQRFLREASLAAGLSHPNIVVVHDVGRDGATQIPFMALEYLEGRTLAQMLETGQTLDWREALRIAASLADALHHAHSRGIVHRDVKPSNIMILPSGQPKILDFGIAKAMVGGLTASGEFWGSPAYMSPEQASGYLVDGRSDLFSLGSVLYELLAGCRAFKGDGIVEIMYHVVNDDPPPLSLVRPGLPHALDALLARALQKDPAERYSDGPAFAKAIEHALRAEDQATISAAVKTLTWRSPPAALAPTQVPARTRRLRPVLGVAAVMALAALPLSSSNGSVPPSAALAPFAVSSRQSVPTTTALAIAAPVPIAAPVAAPAQLAISIEHSVKQGRLRLWIDDTLALERPLVGTQTRRALFLKRNSGRLATVMAVLPGERRLRFEVEGDDDGTRSALLSGVFKSGEGRMLKMKVGDKIEAEWVP